MCSLDLSEVGTHVIQNIKIALLFVRYLRLFEWDLDVDGGGIGLSHASSFIPTASDSSALNILQSFIPNFQIKKNKIHPLSFTQESELPPCALGQVYIAHVNICGCGWSNYSL